MQINSVKFVKIDVMGSTRFVKIVMTDSSRVRTDKRANVLHPTASGLEVEEVNAVDMLQEIVEITVDSGAAKNVWPIRKKGVTRTKATKTVMLAAASGSPIHVEGDARLEFVRDGKKCNVKLFDADVKRPLACVIVDREHEHWPEDSNDQEERRVCSAVGRTSGFENDEKCEVR